MYAPTLFTNDLYKLWTHDSAKDSIRAFEDFRNGNTNSNRVTEPSNGQGNGSSKSNEQVIEEQRKYMRSLFAPPLSAYSADIPGASLPQLEYTIQNTALLSGVGGSAFDTTTTPLTQLKIHQLDQISNTGYSTMRPIGIHRTMEEIDFEDARRYNTSDQQIDDHSYINTAENTNTEGQGAGVNGSNISMRDAQQEEVDLDAQVLDMDEAPDDSNTYGEDSQFDEDDEANLRIHGHDRFLHEERQPEESPAPTRANLVAEGFMADEVEYQDDHSLAADNGQMLMNSGATGTSFTSNLNSASVATNLTSLTGESGFLVGDASFSNARECVGQDFDDEQSDQDMVIEE